MEPLTLAFLLIGGAVLIDAGGSKRKHKTAPVISDRVTIEGRTYTVPTYPETRLVTRSDLGIEPYIYGGDLFLHQRVALVLSWDRGAQEMIGRVVEIEPVPDQGAQRLRVQIVEEFQGEEVESVKAVDIADQIEISRRNIIFAYGEGVT